MTDWTKETPDSTDWTKETPNAESVGESTSEGPNSPGTMADDDTVGTVAWSGLDNAKVSDDNDTYTQISSSNTISHYLKATNFGFSIPTGATIDGILVEFEKGAQTSPDVRDNEVKIVKADGSIGTENKADTATSYPTSFTYISHGSSSDLWSEAWTAEDINDVDFGVVLSSKWYSGTTFPWPQVDHIRITVYYTTEATWTKETPNSTDWTKK